MPEPLSSPVAANGPAAMPRTITAKLRDYYALTKPGIIYGNLLTAAAGFGLAALPGAINIGLLAALLAGTSLVIGSACVFNNCLDRHIDQAMARTRERALVSGRIKLLSALIYAAVLGITGVLVLWRWTNGLTLLIGLIAFVDYVLLYGWSKRRSVYGTLVGSISGAAPIVAGYTAVTDRFDVGALLLFIVMAVWQMPHFYAIALYRMDEYKAAGIPVWPLKKGIASTKRQIMAYIVLFVAAAVLLSTYGYTGYTYAIGMSLLGAAWLWRGYQHYAEPDAKRWGRRMFLFSLIVVMGLSALTAIGGWLP
jgi:protoheme IX farnesyltransferase